MTDKLVFKRSRKRLTEQERRWYSPGDRLVWTEPTGHYKIILDKRFGGINIRRELQRYYALTRTETADGIPWDILWDWIESHKTYRSLASAVAACQKHARRRAVERLIKQRKKCRTTELSGKSTSKPKARSKRPSKPKKS